MEILKAIRLADAEAKRNMQELRAKDLEIQTMKGLLTQLIVRFGIPVDMRESLTLIFKDGEFGLSTSQEEE